MHPKPNPTTLALLLASLLTPLAAGAEQVLLAVAANFTATTRDLIPLFESATGHTAKASYGSTGKLYAQIANGAPFEVFLAADAERPAQAERDGLAVAGSRFTYATGRLVLWSPRADAFDDGERALRDGGFARLAIANPDTAPYGLAARQTLERLGYWNALQPRLVRGESIAQTFQFVATGNAGLGFVALAQLHEWRGGAGSRWTVPAQYHAPIEQQAVLLTRGAENPAARAFLEFLREPEARAVIERYGYGTD